VSNTRSIEHAHCPIVFGASFLWIERSSLRTTQRAVRLEEKVLSPQVSDSRRASPLRGRDQLVQPGRGSRMAEIQ